MVTAGSVTPILTKRGGSTCTVDIPVTVLPWTDAVTVKFPTAVARYNPFSPISPSVAFQMGLMLIRFPWLSNASTLNCRVCPAFRIAVLGLTTILDTICGRMTTHAVACPRTELPLTLAVTRKMPGRSPAVCRPSEVIAPPVAFQMGLMVTGFSWMSYASASNC